MKVIAWWVLLIFTAVQLIAQTDSSKHFSFTAYAELYYSYDFAKPGNKEKPAFVYNYKKHNEPNINLVFARGSFQKNSVKATLALMAGNYANYNLSAEPDWARPLLEANAGFKLSAKEELWVEAGILPSHIGFESAVGADCWNLTRSLLAENSPYYETGIKLSYTSKDNHIKTAVLVLNGWQHIQRPAASNKPCYGLQFTYQPQEKLTLNYSNFIGKEQPDSSNAVRVFNNLYAIYEPSKKLGITVGLDIGRDKYTTAHYGNWFSPVLIARYKINSNSALAARLEYYSDKKQVIIKTTSTNGFSTWGSSINYDYRFFKKGMLRAELKYYTSKDMVFTKNGTPANNNLSFTTAISVKL
jgi:Putative beta-barrel porin-2, OmpL-like. bbp2